MDTVPFPCPRCGATLDPSALYGPCAACRGQLRAVVRAQPRPAEVVAYEPKVNVVANQVATKE